MLCIESQFNCRAPVRKKRCVFLEVETNLYTIKEHSCLLGEGKVHYNSTDYCEMFDRSSMHFRSVCLSIRGIFYDALW